MIKKYLDFVERLRGLNSVAKDLVKLLKKSKIENIEELIKHFDFWKAFVAINTNLAILETKDVDFNHPGCFNYLKALFTFNLLLFILSVIHSVNVLSTFFSN